MTPEEVEWRARLAADVSRIRKEEEEWVKDDGKKLYEIGALITLIVVAFTIYVMVVL